MADLTANRITNDADIIKTQIQQKTDNGMKAIRPETDTDIVINKSTINGNTVTDVLDNTLPITAGQNISITPSASGLEIAFTGSLAPNVSVEGTSPITVSSSVTDTAATYTVSVNGASTSAKGVVQLSTSTSSTSTTTAATPSAVKAAYDLASGKQNAFTDGSATIATAGIGGVITIKAGVSQSGGTISNSSGSNVTTYTVEQIDSLVAGLTKYLGTATDVNNLIETSSANAGDFFRVTHQFSSSGWGTAHVGDIVILKKDAPAGGFADIANWEIIHTGDNTSYGIVNKTTDGLAPKWSTSDTTKIASANYVLMNDGTNVKWRQLPSTSFSDNNTTYTLSNGDTANTVKLTSSSGNAQTVTINNVAHASSADQASTASKVANSLTIKLNSGSTEGSNQFVYNGSAAKSVNITASGIGAATSSHTHGNITNGGSLQTNDITIANGDKLVVTDSSDSAKIARSSVTFDGSTRTKALTPAGTWESFIKGVRSGTNATGAIISSTFGSDGLATLGDSGVTPGVYCALQVNSKGIVTAGAHVIKIYENGTTIGPELVTGGFAFIKI